MYRFPDEPWDTLGKKGRPGGMVPAVYDVGVEVARAAAKAGHTIKLEWGYAPGRPASSEHGQGRAVDFMGFVNGNLVVDPAILDWTWRYLWKHRERLGLEYEITERKIRSTVTDAGDVRYYGGSNPHTDHVHATFLKSFTKYVPPPKGKGSLQPRKVNRRAVNYALAHDDDKGRTHPSHALAVRYFQTALNKVLGGENITVDGWYGDKTRWQAARYLAPKLGSTSPRTIEPAEAYFEWEDWTRLAKESGVFYTAPEVSLHVFNNNRDGKEQHATVRLAQRALARALKIDLAADGWYGPKTRAAVAAWQRKEGGRKDGILSWRQWRDLARVSGDVFCPKG